MSLTPQDQRSLITSVSAMPSDRVAHWMGTIGLELATAGLLSDNDRCTTAAIIIEHGGKVPPGLLADGDHMVVCFAMMMGVTEDPDRAAWGTFFDVARGILRLPAESRAAFFETADKIIDDVTGGKS